MVFAAGSVFQTLSMAEQVCSRRQSIARENERRLKDMHPRAPEIDEKTFTIKGLIIICDSPKYVADDGEELAYLCERCRKEVGGSLEARGAKIRPIGQTKA